MSFSEKKRPRVLCVRVAHEKSERKVDGETNVTWCLNVQLVFTEKRRKHANYEIT